jgi:hypothetical protein
VDGDLLHHVEETVGIRNAAISSLVDLAKETLGLFDALVEHGLRDPLIDNASHDFTLLSPLLPIIGKNIPTELAHNQRRGARLLEIARPTGNLPRQFRIACADLCSATSHQKESLIIPGLAVFLEGSESVAELPSVDAEVESFIDPFREVFLVRQSAGGGTSGKGEMMLTLNLGRRGTQVTIQSGWF